MAGSYNDAPSRRNAYDQQGAVVLHQLNSNVPTALSAGAIADLNDEDNVAAFTYGASSGWAAEFYFLFAQKIEIDGYFAGVSNSDAPRFVNRDLLDSPDTTNGIDGVWTVIDSPIVTFTTTFTTHRDNILSLARPGKKGIHFGYDKVTGAASDSLFFQSMHLYGPISPGEIPDRILFLDTLAADAVFTKVLDFGDVPRGQTQTRTFKIKNNSASFTINTIQVTALSGYLNSGDWYEFGDDGVTYQATYSVGNLGPAATKLIYLKQIVPDAEVLGVHVARIEASHASLT